MIKTKLATAALVMKIACALGGAPAHAASKAWVSENGNDTGTCSFFQPCRTLSFAYSQTAAGGEVGILGPGDYGFLLIAKAISITNDGGGEAGIQPTSSSGIVIQGGASDAVQLRGLTIDGAALVATGMSGIFFNSGASLSVQNSVVKNFRTGYGILFEPNATASLVVSDTTTANNSSAIFIAPSAGTADVAIERVVANGNSFGGIIAAGNSAGGVNMTVTDSLVAGNAYGVLADPNGGGPLVVMIERSKVVNNVVGVASYGANTTVLLSNSTVTGNTNGLIVGSTAVLGSYGNNNIDKNGTDGVPSKTFVQK